MQYKTHILQIFFPLENWGASEIREIFTFLICFLWNPYYKTGQVLNSRASYIRSNAKYTTFNVQQWLMWHLLQMFPNFLLYSRERLKPHTYYRLIPSGFPGRDTKTRWMWPTVNWKLLTADARKFRPQWTWKVYNSSGGFSTATSCYEFVREDNAIFQYTWWWVWSLSAYHLGLQTEIEMET